MSFEFLEKPKQLLQNLIDLLSEDWNLKSTYEECEDRINAEYLLKYFNESPETLSKENFERINFLIKRNYHINDMSELLSDYEIKSYLNMIHSELELEKLEKMSIPPCKMQKIYF